MALASKTYICEQIDSKYKISAKGANRGELMRNNPMQKCEGALMERKSVTVTNRGFISQKGVIRTYSSERTVISFVYFKRWVYV